MKCEDCSKIVRPVVVFDIDGTLAQYHHHLLWFLFNYFNLDANEFQTAAEWDGEGKMFTALGITHSQYREAKLAFRQGGMKRTMPLFDDGGVQLVQHLYMEGCHVWYATTRPWQRLDNVDPDTRWWLETHHLPIDGLLFDADKYRKLVDDHVDRERIIGIVDDLPEQYDAAEFLGLPVFQIARQHNSGPTVKRPNRGTMAQASDWLSGRLAEWKEQHNG